MVNEVNNSKPTTYGDTKVVANGFLNLSLLTANASQLRYILGEGPSHQHYIFLIVMIVVSMALQIAVSIILAYTFFLHDKQKSRIRPAAVQIVESMTRGNFEEALMKRLDRAAKETTKKALEVHVAMKDVIKPTIKEGMEKILARVPRVDVEEATTYIAETAEEKISTLLEGYLRNEGAITKDNAMSAVKKALKPTVKKALKRNVDASSERRVADVAETTSEEALKKAEDISMSIRGESRVEGETEPVRAAADHTSERSSEEAEEAKNAVIRFYRFELAATVLVGIVSCLNVIISVFSGL